MTTGFTLNRLALDRLVNGPAGRRVLDQAAVEIRDRARANAAAIQPGHESAIITESGVDSSGVAYADIGYDKTNPGFVLWWAEVGTASQPPQPHLRPAVRPQ